ncbi:hypothetical protein EYR36_001214 [Pleurotus pulmonarius]|nr:hypothetical protein EYR36_001214 [Pleurotus pulmonarius]
MEAPAEAGRTTEVEEAAILLLGDPHLLIHRNWIPMTRLAVTGGVTERLKRDSTLGGPLGTNERTPPRLPLAGTSRRATELPQMARPPARNPTSVMEVVGGMVITTAIVIEEDDRTEELPTHDATWTSMTNARWPATSGAALVYRVGTWGWLAPSTSPTSRSTRELFGSGVKPPSHVQKPEKWSGDQDVDKFNRWLHSLMRWLRINQYSVPAREEECITLIGLHLDGEAAVWFDEEVEDADDERQWTFLRVVIGLYDRFVQPTAIQDATEEFLATEYSPTTGVRGFYDALERTAKRMIHPPDHYMFRRQFVRHPISDLYAVALQAEESRIMAKHYTHAATANKARNHPGAGTSTAKVDKPAMQVGSRPSNRVHNSKGYAFGLRRPPTDDRAVDAPAQAPLQKTTTTTLSKPHPPSQPRVMNRNPPGRTGGGQFDATKAKCYACGNFGHISTDPKCPKYGQPRLNAARVENGSEGDTAREPHNEDVEDALPEDFPAADDEGNLDGSQYSSPDDDNGYDRYYDVAEDNVHMGVMDTTYSPEGVQLFGVRALDPPAGGNSAAIGETTRISAMRPKYQPSGQPMERPKRAHIITKSIAQYVVINGVRAYTLFDSGCTTDCMSPDFARVAKVKYGYLKDVVPLQLGTVGSSASIQFGTYSRVLFGGIDSREYFDVANMDRYDVILGTPWMHKHGISLDFANRVIRIGDQAHPSLTEGEESMEMARRHAIRKKE